MYFQLEDAELNIVVGVRVDMSREYVVLTDQTDGEMVPLTFAQLVSLQEFIDGQRAVIEAEGTPVDTSVGPGNTEATEADADTPDDGRG